MLIFHISYVKRLFLRYYLIMSIHQPQFGPENTGKIESNAEITSQILAEATTIQIRPEDRNRNGQLLVFPGGPVSNLPEKLWRIVRTKTFREWFGDWQNPPVKSFKTAKGSIYSYDSEGKTSRYKTATSEQHERQDLTVFVNLSLDEEQDYLQAYRGAEELKAKVYVVERQADDSPKILRDISQVVNPDRVYLAIVKNITITQLKKASTRPVKGWNSFDTRQYMQDGQTFTERHLGNKVVEVEYDTSHISKVLDNNGEPLVLGNGDDSISFVRMKNPFDTNAEYVTNWMKQNNLETDPRRFDRFMEYLKSQGYDGLIVGGRPARDSITGKPGCDESQILRLKQSK